MELKDFIRETLIGIAAGVQEAKIKTADLWAIAPGALHGERIVETSFVDFDIAVTVSENVQKHKEGKGAVKAEISVLGARIGGNLGENRGDTEQVSSENVSRVSFRVPVYMNAHFHGDPRLQEERELFKKWQINQRK